MKDVIKEEITNLYREYLNDVDDHNRQVSLGYERKRVEPSFAGFMFWLDEGWIKTDL